MENDPSGSASDWLSDRAIDNCPVLARHVSGFRILDRAERSRHEITLQGQGVVGFTCGCLPDNKFPLVDRRTVSHVMSEDDTATYMRDVRKWLFRRGVPFRSVVRVHDYARDTVETTWKLLMRYWPVFFRGTEDAVVTDASFQWALSFCHHGPWVFGCYTDAAGRSTCA